MTETQNAENVLVVQYDNRYDLEAAASERYVAQLVANGYVVWESAGHAHEYLAREAAEEHFVACMRRMFNPAHIDGSEVPRCRVCGQTAEDCVGEFDAEHIDGKVCDD